jgi:two-component system alkaline phosphatase synthesis response regulator PhoP
MTRKSTTRRILLLEDDPDLLKMMTLHLGGHGYDVTPCESGLCAVIAYLGAIEKAAPFEVLLLDCALPFFDGFTVAKIARITESTGIVNGHRSRVAFFTAFPHTVERMTLVQELGGERCWRKPDDIVELPQLIEEWLSEEKGAGA